MRKLLSGYDGFSWGFGLAFLLLLALTALLLVTVAMRHRVLPPQIYVLAAALGMLGYLVSSALAARGGYQLIGPLTAGVLLIIMVPSGLLVEAGIVGWLGTKGLWRIFFLIFTALGGIFFLRLAAVLFPRLGK